jgi:hypothetical protein
MPDLQTALKEALNEWDDSLGRHQVEKQQPTPLPEVTQMQNTQQAQPTQIKLGRAPKPENESERREIFYFIKGNPDCSLQDLTDCGFDHGATSTHLSTMYFNGKITRKTARVTRPHKHGGLSERDVFIYTAAVSEYEDIPAVVPNKQAKKIIVRKKKAAAQQAHGIAALPTEIKPSQGILRDKTPEESARIGRPTYVTPQTASPIPANITAEYVIKHISLSEAVKLHAELKKMLG